MIKADPEKAYEIMGADVKQSGEQFGKSPENLRWPDKAANQKFFAGEHAAVHARKRRRCCWRSASSRHARRPAGIIDTQLRQVGLSATPLISTPASRARRARRTPMLRWPLEPVGRARIGLGIAFFVLFVAVWAVATFGGYVSPTFLADPAHHGAGRLGAASPSTASSTTSA